MISTEQQPDSAAHEPVTSTRWRAVLLASVAACAACGIIYELALLTLSTSLNGGGIIATGDPNDLSSLAREHANIKIQALS